jgi:hypothetical protein
MRTLLESQASQFAILNSVLVYRFKDGAGVLSSKLRLISGTTLKAYENPVENKAIDGGSA